MFRPHRSLAARGYSTFFRRQFSSEISAKEAAEIASSPALLQGQGQPQLSDSIPNPTPVRKSAAFLKYGLFGSLVGAAAAAGYATYEYTTEEVDERIKAFRALASFNVKNDASPLEKFQAVAYAAPLAASEKLLPDLRPMEKNVFTLVLDLNETLIYLDWKYADPIVECLDQKCLLHCKLSRDATKYQNGKHYRDLSKLNRDPSRILYASGHALKSRLQPENCVQIKPWKLEAEDTTLRDLLSFLKFVAREKPADIKAVLASYQGQDIPTEFLKSSKEHQRLVIPKFHGN